MAALWTFLVFFILWVVAWSAHWVPAATWTLFIVWLVFLVLAVVKRPHRRPVQPMHP